VSEPDDATARSADVPAEVNEELSLVLELQLGQEHGPRGRLRGPTGAAVPFDGYVELIGALEQLRGRAG
jgi:hypothetical protein